MANISEMTARILSFRNQRNWGQFHNPKDMALSLMLEAAELGEHFQWKNAAEIGEHVQNHKDAIAEELSDVLYWVLLMAIDLGIEIGQAFERKMDINEKKYPVDKCRDRHTKYSSLE